MWITLPQDLLVGREAELAILEQLFDESLALGLENGGSGTGSCGGVFCHLQGKPGVGKTALVKAFASSKKRGLFCSYKFNQFGHPTPMDAIVQTLTQLAHQTVSCPQYSDSNKDFLKRLTSCPTLRALVEMVPAYGTMIRNPAQLKPIPEGLAAGDVHKILYPAIAHVLKETQQFSQTAIVIFLDDVQWIDPATLGVLQYLLQEGTPVFLLVAFRDQSSQSSFQLDSLLLKTHAGLKIVGMELSEFTHNHVSQLLSRLQLPPDDHQDLAHFLFEQTEGNPFYLRFRLSVMAETGALVCCGTSKNKGMRWKLDRDRISLGMQMHSEDALDYCLRQLQSLEPAVVAVLARIALLPQGQTVKDYATTLHGERVLTQLATKSSTTLLEVLEKALRVAVQKSIMYHHTSASDSGGIFESCLQQDTYLSVDGCLGRSNSGDSETSYLAFSFAHDRLQQAAAQCLSSVNERAEIHFFLGKRRLLGEYKALNDGGRDADGKTCKAKGDNKRLNGIQKENLSGGSRVRRQGRLLPYEDEDSTWDETCTSDSDLTRLCYQNKRDMEAFEILQHFFEAKHLITDPQMVVQIGELAARASGYHLAAGSYEQFDSMLQFVRDLLEPVRRNQNPAEERSSTLCGKASALQVQLLIAHHQIKFLMNDLRAAEEIFDAVRPLLSSPQEIRDAYFSRISLLINSQDHPGAIVAVGEALARLKEESVPADLVLPEGQPNGLVLEVTQKIKNLFVEHPDWNAEQVANSLPISTDEDHNFRVEMMISVIASIYLVGRFDLYLFIPSVACLKVLENGLTRSSGHAFSVLGFALVAMFSDPFGAEVAMIGRHLVDRFHNPTCMCRALVLSGMTVIYDRRYEHLATDQLYTSYVAGRTAHDILWACYGVYLLSCMHQFQGVSLSEMVESLDDLVAYAMSEGHQVLAQRGCRAILHTTQMLMTGTSDEGAVFHFSIPDDKTSKLVPLIPFTHAATSIVLLYFDGKHRIAWQMIQEVLDKGLDQAAPGIPIVYSFHMYTVLVCHSILLDANSISDNTDTYTSTIPATGMMGESGFPVSEEERKKMKYAMAASRDYLENRSKMAPIFIPYARLAKGCVADVVENHPWEALKEVEGAIAFVSQKQCGKHYDLLIIANLVLADIFRRQELLSTHHMHRAKAISLLRKWGADYIAEKLSKNISGKSPEVDDTQTITSTQAASDESATSSNPPLGSATHVSHSPSSFSRRQREGTGGPNFAEILSTGSYISSFRNFDELVEKLSSALLKQAKATRLLLFVRQGDSDQLEPRVECTFNGLSSIEDLATVRYSSSIVKISDTLKERLVVHSAQQESPYCFESYIQESKVQSVASMPITYKDSVIAVVYLEHECCQGIFTPNVMATMALLGQNVSSAIVNARLLRDLENRKAQLEQSHAFLAKALRVKDTILSNTSHELRTPLSGIIGLNEYLLELDLDLHPEVRNCAKTTLANAQHLLSLVDDILDLSRLNEGKLQLHYETKALRPLVEEVCEVAKFSLGDNANLANKIDPSIELMVDPARIKQVLSNLISNAIKFTPEGTVTVTCELSEDEGMAVILVTDTGIGIESSQLDSIFEPFIQATSYETRRYQGTGLGLSIARRLVKLHGGRINVVSNVGVGSSFHVYLPTIPPRTSPGSVEVSPGIQIQPANPTLETVNFTPKAKVSTSKRAGQFEQADKVSMTHLTTEPLPPEGAKSSREQSLFAISKTAVETQVEATRPGKVTPLFSMTDADTLKSTVVKFGQLPGNSLSSPAPPDNTQRKDMPANNHTDVPVAGDTLSDEPLRILAVDDTALNLKVICNFLRKANMIVSTATNGQELLEKIDGDEWTNYDVILLDWMMPIMDGITACRLLRQRIPMDLLPVIFLTAKTDPDAVQKGFEAGGTDFTTKPLNRQAVVARTRCQGLLSRRARARYYEALPIAHAVLTVEPFWKMRSATGQKDLFVICFYVPDKSCGLDGPTLLQHFQREATTYESGWQFCELGECSVSFLAFETTTWQIEQCVRSILSCWAEAKVLTPGSNTFVEPARKSLVTIGVDFRPVRVHLFGDRQPMLGAVESCSQTAWELASKATEHEEVVLSESARLAMKNVPDKKDCRRYRPPKNH